MNLHEYQAKALLQKFNVPVQEGIACTTVDEAVNAYAQISKETNSKFAVVKAQIHAGGRGKGKIVGSEQRGVQVAKSADDVKTIATNLLGGTLVTIQTGEAGKVVNKIFVAKDAYYSGASEVKEFYLSILLDRAESKNVIMYSTEGGMDIEEVAHNTPEKIFKEWVQRHPDVEALRDFAEEDPTEVEAGKFNLNFVKLDGNVGCMVNGAGLAMATMDMIKLSGGEPANFLDVGGTANATTVEAGFRIILRDPNVKAILVNIFGGIVRCDRVAQGVVDAYNNIGEIKVPIIVRLQGTNAEAAKELIEKSGLKVESAIQLEEAATLVKQALN